MKDDPLNFIKSSNKRVNRDGYVQRQSTGLSTKNYGSTGSLHRLVERIKDSKSIENPLGNSKVDVMISDQSQKVFNPAELDELN